MDRHDPVHVPAQDPTDVVGRRIGAALIDLIVLVLLSILLAALIGDTSTEGGQASFSLEGASALVWLALSLLYYGLSEALAGQRIGDLAAKTTVTRA